VPVFVFQLFENSLIIYFTLYLLLELLFFLIFIVNFVRQGKKGISNANQMTIEPQDAISILVPAYNEEVSIQNCIEMLSRLDYPYYEIIVINDGSRDATLQKALAVAKFRQKSLKKPSEITTQKIRTVYHHKCQERNIWIIDKENGGKADALNAGLKVAKYPYLCTIDADSILDREALKWIIQPFKQNPATVIAGGNLAVLNDTKIVDGCLRAARFPRKPLVIFQIIEYIKSFMVSRTGLSKLRGLLVMSGAFSVFRRDLLVKAGGFLSRFNHHPTILKYFKSTRHTVCEDLEAVIRVMRYAVEKGRDYRIQFLPHPVCWTEVPETISQLARQRERWHRGLGEALFYHRRIMFDPAYGSLGLMALPYYLLFEWLSPLIKAFTVGFIIVMFFINMLHASWLLMLFLSITFGAAVLMSLATVIVENWSAKRSEVNRDALRYKHMLDWLKLVIFSILSDFSYTYIRIYWQIKGIFYFLKKETSWNKFSRKGIIKVEVQT
jgi:cellulose synthase/poly-beta-1,6-N-acetylglucosamine synthase-like glycosyltransferase